MNPFSKIKENLFSIFQTALIVLLVVLVVVFAVVMIPDCPEWIFNRLGIAGTEHPKYEALKFLGIGMGGILIALQALMSYKRAKAMEKTAEAQADAARAQADAVSKTEQGQRQDRLKNAIEHLGHESDSVRPRRGLRTLPFSGRYGRFAPDSARYSLRPYPTDNRRKRISGKT